LNSLNKEVSMSFLLFVVTTTAMSDQITIVADEWPPYNSIPNSKEPGYGIEIAKHVFEATGHTVVYKILPWHRSIIETRTGKYNAIIGAFKQEAPDFVFPEEEFGLSKNAFFARKGREWTYSGLESLQGMKIGIIKGYSYGEELDKYFKENPQQVQYVYSKDPLFQNIKKLLVGRLDVFIEDENVLLQKLKKMQVADKIVNAGFTGVSEKLYITFSPKIKKSKEYAEILTKGIRKLKESGELDKILAKYGLKYWK